MCQDLGFQISISLMALIILWFFWQHCFFFLDNIEEGTYTLKGFEDFGIEPEAAVEHRKCLGSVFLKNLNQLCEYCFLFCNIA